MTVITISLILSVLFLAYTNGANDNFKGVATLFGSDTTNYKTALTWATLTTFAGSLFAIFMATLLIKHFSGKGLVPDHIAISPEFLLAVSLGAGLTVLIATFKGLPISTTHSLTGALTGAGLMAVGFGFNFSKLGSVFFLPLVVSPLLALLLSAIIYKIAHFSRTYFGFTKEKCFCVGSSGVLIPASQLREITSLEAVNPIDFKIDTEKGCIEYYQGNFFGISLQKVLDAAHFLSAGAVCFARGLNDTPKIVALLLAMNALEIKTSLLLVGIAMALGGIINARRVAVTMSKKITPMNHGQGFVANITTGFLVIFASRLGFPVSTTHVSVGSISGIGLLTGNADKNVLSEIMLSWLMTLPIAAFISAVTFLFLGLVL
ncbi:MAG: phosphate transporter [marine bacterium B5-7]|nr:MAG: phosphate transporter [marine bacterium B5-7]